MASKSFKKVLLIRFVSYLTVVIAFLAVIFEFGPIFSTEALSYISIPNSVFLSMCCPPTLFGILKNPNLKKVLCYLIAQLNGQSRGGQEDFGPAP